MKQCYIKFNHDKTGLTNISIVDITDENNQREKVFNVYKSKGTPAPETISTDILYYLDILSQDGCTLIDYTHEETTF